MKPPPSLGDGKADLEGLVPGRRHAASTLGSDRHLPPQLARCIIVSEDQRMTAKEAILKEIDGVPDTLLVELLNVIKQLKLKGAIAHQQKLIQSIAPRGAIRQNDGRPVLS